MKNIENVQKKWIAIIVYFERIDFILQLVCPMCRLEMGEVDLADERARDESTGDEQFVYKPDEKELQAQRERQRILEYQKGKGGIIDIEEQRNKYLIEIKNTKV